MADKPLLPPRQPAAASISGASITSSAPYSKQHDHPRPAGLSPYSSDFFNDARASSQQSLHPIVSSDDDDGNNKRTLLLIYIHGFLGDETSFKSFPAHVHNLLSMSLADTHVVYSKIYPRYQSRKKIEFARDDFSRWLFPHESPMTDVVLLGHSLGGILAAEVILKPAVPSGDQSPSRPQQQFQHKILGLVAFDSPFLGIHPSVVGTGIASLFRGAPPPPPPPPPPSDETSSSAGAPAAAGAGAATDTSSTSTADSSSTSELLSAPTTDQNFNPAYTNDIHLTRRTGKLNRAFYFLNKHWGSVNTAMCNYIDSHFEHGGVLADYPGLRRRYNAIRALEDVNPFFPSSSTRLESRRVRFVNYYSASTGWVDDKNNNKEEEEDTTTTTITTPNPDDPGGSLHPDDDDDNNDDDTSTSSHRHNSTNSPPSITQNPSDTAEAEPDSHTSIRSLSISNDDDKAAPPPPPVAAAHPPPPPLPPRQKDRKFCMLPWSSSSANTDRTWIRVPMAGMDQVTAHTSMFSMSEAYAQLVGDTAARIEAWVREDEGAAAAAAAAAVTE